MTQEDLAIVITVGGFIATGVMSLIKRFAPDLQPFWRTIILLVISLVTVWGYQLYNVGFEKIMDDPLGTFLSMIAVTGLAVSVYEVIGKPSTVSPRIEGTYTPAKK